MLRNAAEDHMCRGDKRPNSSQKELAYFKIS